MICCQHRRHQFPAYFYKCVIIYIMLVVSIDTSSLLLGGNIDYLLIADQNHRNICPRLCSQSLWATLHSWHQTLRDIQIAWLLSCVDRFVSFLQMSLISHTGPAKTDKAQKSSVAIIGRWFVRNISTTNSPYIFTHASLCIACRH